MSAENVADATAFVEMTPVVTRVISALLRQAARHGFHEIRQQLLLSSEDYGDAEFRKKIVDDTVTSLYCRAAREGRAVLACHSSGWQRDNLSDSGPTRWGNRVWIVTVSLSEMESP